jgi:hypothetical protein
MKKIKNMLLKISNLLFYGRYKKEMKDINKNSNFKEYVIKIILSLIVFFIVYFLLFEKIVISVGLTIVTSMFYINQIYLNKKKIEYENYLLAQYSIYTTQTAMLINFNNVYSSLNKVIQFLDQPLKRDVEQVIIDIKNNKSLIDAFEPFNKKYNNRILTQFNKALVIFADNGDSEANITLHHINEQLNELKILKDKYLRFKSGWRNSYYIVVFMALSMPLLLKWVIPDIYFNFIYSWGGILLTAIIFINLFVTKIVEEKYRDQNIGEGGY